MPKSKRSRPLEDDPSPRRNLRSRLTHQAPPTLDDARSTADSGSSANAPPGPANPGVVRSGNQGVLSRPLPTPDDVRPVADSLSSAKIPYNPANPGICRIRHEGIRSRLPPDSDIFDVFAKLRRDQSLSDEAALMEFLATYDVPIAIVNQISGNVYPFIANFFMYLLWSCIANINDL
jgi:hypothetical protein